MQQHEIPIPEFFAGKNIFITGATGFMGKALIEKLLRSCPKIGTIYILLRPKRGKQLSERITQLTNDALYDRLKHEQPNLNLAEKIIPFAGELIQLGLGLSSHDRSVIIEKVNIIFHVAASVRFDDSLKEAIILNVRGTREVCQLALDVKHLSAHIHVSTAFANCDRSEAREMLYPPKVDWKYTIEIAEKFDSHILDILTQKYMGNMPNTYCFTKNVAEHVVNDMCRGKIPAKIFRPSIVISTLREEPVTGWIDNFNGPVGVMTAYGKGIMRTIYAHGQYKPDYIPVDIATKALVVCTWDLALRHNIQGAEVIQCTSHNAAEWMRPSIETLANSAIEVSKELPLNNILWIPSKHTTNSTFIMYIRTVLFMLIPSLLLDGLLQLAGKKPILTKLQRKIYIAQLALRHFMTNEWDYPNDNFLQLQHLLHPDDVKDWDLRFGDFNFKDFVRQAIMGCRRYLLKESDDTLEQAKVHYKRMYWINFIVQIAICYWIFLTIWRLDFVQGGFQKITNTF